MSAGDASPAQAGAQQRPRRRPRLVTTLTAGVLTFSAIHALRLVGALSMPPLPTTLPPLYFSISGAAWATLGLWLSYGLWRGRRWALRLLLPASLAYAAWHWLDRLAFSPSDYTRASWPAALGMTALWIGLILIIIHRRPVRHYFEEKP